jgi:hypothetical protein
MPYSVGRRPKIIQSRSITSSIITGP